MKPSRNAIINKVWITIVIAAADASGFKSITFVSATAHAGGFKLQAPQQCLPVSRLEKMLQGTSGGCKGCWISY